MAKTQFGPRTMLYPMPAFIIGANVNGKANFMTAAWCGIVNSEPPMVSVGIRHQRHTYKGIKENMTFSVNVPSTDIVKETDYIGIASGAKVDKVKVCKFDVFYGKLLTAPLLEQCPVNLECKVVQILDLGTHALIVGKIEESYVSDSCLTDNKPDVDKIKPFVFSGNKYYAYGKAVAQAFNAGKELTASE